MTLHLEQIVQDIERMSTHLSVGERRGWLQEARRLLRHHDTERLAAKLTQHESAQRSLLFPHPLGALDDRIPAPPPPVTYAVAAADGSNIPPDRDSPARYYLLNTGLVTLQYGREPAARIEARAKLFYQEEDLYWGANRQRPVDSNRLSLLMRVEEIGALGELAGQLEQPSVVLVDGQLIMWALQSEDMEDQKRLVGYLMDTFDTLRDQKIPIVGYISGTESFELVNALKIYLCPTSPTDCLQCHRRGEAELELCYHLNSFRDPALLFDFLSAGERTCCFASRASILSHYRARHPDHEICYFYMSTGDEIARVEFPRWVAEDPVLLDRIHSVLHDQCGRSGQQPPYPPVLHEAHEAAVISRTDRDWVTLLIAEQLQRAGAPSSGTAKSYHKRMRGV